MVEYLVFLGKGLGLIGAISAALYLWHKNKADKIKKPIKTENGNYLVENENNLDKEVNHDAKLKIDLAANSEYARLPNPDGTPTKGPR